MDGDSNTLPVVFEDQYQHVAEFARRRSIANRKSGNDVTGKLNVAIFFNSIKHKYLTNI